MKLLFNIAGVSKMSPDFGHVPDPTVDRFFDEFLGGAAQDPELFWKCDVSQSDDTIIVDWFDSPTNFQKIVDDIGAELGVVIAPYATW